MNKRPSIDDYYTIPDLIKFLGANKQTVYYWLRIGMIPQDMIGNTKIVLMSDAREFKNSLY